MSRLTCHARIVGRAAIVTTASVALLAPLDAGATHAAGAATVTITQVAEMPARSLTLFHGDAARAYGLAHDAATGTALVALDASGQITHEVPLPEFGQLLGWHHVGDRTFVRAMSAACELYELDTTAVALVPTFTISTSSCGGPFTADPAIPTTLWFTERSANTIVTFDTVTSTSATIALPPAIPEHYVLSSVFGVDGDVAYVSFDSDYDPATGAPYTAPDGSELPGLLGRLDLVAGVLDVAPGGNYAASLPDGQLVTMVDGEAQLVDPVTLALTPAGAGVELFAPQPLLAGTRSWTFDVDVDTDSSDVVAMVHDAASLAELGRATAPTGLAPDTYTTVSTAAITDTVLIVVTNEIWDEATQTVTRNSVLFTATA